MLAFQHAQKHYHPKRSCPHESKSASKAEPLSDETDKTGMIIIVKHPPLVVSNITKNIYPYYGKFTEKRHNTIEKTNTDNSKQS